jgi:hypothetical protein
MYIQTHTHTHTHTHACVCIYMCVYVYTWTPINMYMCIHGPQSIGHTFCYPDGSERLQPTQKKIWRVISLVHFLYEFTTETPLLRIHGPRQVSLLVCAHLWQHCWPWRPRAALTYTKGCLVSRSLLRLNRSLLTYTKGCLVSRSLLRLNRSLLTYTKAAL